MKKSLIGVVVIFLCMAIWYSCKDDSKVIPPGNNGIADESTLKTTLTHFSDTIATNVNGSLLFCEEIQDRVDRWEYIVNNTSSLNLSISDVVIDFENGIYYLTAKDARSKIAARIQLIMDGGNLYERSYGMLSAQTGESCTCTGCLSTGPGSADECCPKNGENGWYCTSCSNGECTKTVTAGDGGFLSL